MRGSDARTGSLFSYVNVEARVRKDHPLRTIRTVVDDALATMEREFARLYSRVGRPSICAGAAAAGDAAAGVLFNPIGAPAHGAAGVRSLVPLVRRAQD